MDFFAMRLDSCSESVTSITSSKLGTFWRRYGNGEGVRNWACRIMMTLTGKMLLSFKRRNCFWHSNEALANYVLPNVIWGSLNSISFEMVQVGIILRRRASANGIK
jgi:hypothetical protein